MKPLIIKGAIATLGVSGLAVGGYYGVQAINSSKSNSKKEERVDTPWEAFEKTHEIFGEGEWQTKYDEFRKGNDFEKFSSALKSGAGSNIVITKDQNDAGGAEALKKWCEALFRVKRNIENAKAYCAKPKTNSENLSRPA